MILTCLDKIMHNNTSNYICTHTHTHTVPCLTPASVVTSRHSTTNNSNRISKQFLFSFVIIYLSVRCFEKEVSQKMCTFLFCPLKISIPFNLLCVWILFQNASSHSCFRFFSRLRNGTTELS